MRVLTDPAETCAVTLALPQDVQVEAYDWPVGFFAKRVWHVRRPVPDPAALAEAAEAVRRARRPLLVAGGGVHHGEAENALRALADATGIPVASTQAGKGSLRHDHATDVGGVGHTGTAAANDLARTADLVIGVGTRYSDFTTASSTLFAEPAVRFVNLNIASFDGHKLAALPLLGDARAGLEALTAALAGHRVPGRRTRRSTRPASGAGSGWSSGRTPRRTIRPGPPRRRCSADWTPSSATTTW